MKARGATASRQSRAIFARRRAAIAIAMGAAFAAHAGTAAVPAVADATLDVSFDRSLLSGAGRNTDDLSRFEHGNPILPGVYNTDIRLNGDWVARRNIRFQTPAGQDSAVPCIDRALLAQLGVQAQDAAGLSDEDTCTSIGDLIPGATATFDLSNLRLDLTVPQAFMGHVARGYVNPEFWDPGVNSALLDYRFNSYRSSSRGQSQTSSYLGLNAGLNLGLWHLRQNSNLTVQSGDGMPTTHHWQSISAYAQRPLPSWRAQLTLGDTYTSGELFDSVGLRGAQLATDDRMLPDSQRGYAPTVRGVADTNAEVSISQNGIVIYQSTVPPGAFVIDDLYPTGYGGDLVVNVTEADGRVRTFSVPYASVAQLMRPGVTRFNISAGQVHDLAFESEPGLVQATVQHGFSNTVTGYGGIVGSQGYGALLAGGAFNTRLGAIAIDLTGARTRIPGFSTQSGQSLRLSYSKILPQTHTSLTVAAYRYSTSGYLGLRDALQARDYARHGLPVFATDQGLPDGSLDELFPGLLTPAQKQALIDNGAFSLRPGVDRPRNRFDLSLTQFLGEGGGSLFANVSSRDYWNRQSTDTQFQLGYNNHIGPLGYSLSATRVRDPLGRDDNQFFASFSLPLGTSAKAPSFTASLNRDSSGRSLTQAMLSGSGGKQNQFTYGASASHGTGDQGVAASISGGYRGSRGQLNASYGKGDGYSQTSLGFSGALVAHPGGVTFGQSTADTVAIVAAADATGTRVANAPNVRVDADGFALVPYVRPFALNTIELDPKGLPLNVQLDTTSSQVAPYAGSVVMVRFKTRSGRSAIIRARRPDGRVVPFGAEVVDARQHTLGVVGQAGRMLVRGVEDRGELTVQWHDEDGTARACSFPYQLGAPAEGKAARMFQQIEVTCAPSSGSGA